MFDNLKELINRQNLNKVRSNQRYLNESHHSSNDKDQSQEYSFEHEVSNRVQAFHKILDNQHSSSYYRSKKEIFGENDILKQKKHRKEKELLQERIKMNEEMHQRQKEYLAEKHLREINILKSQIQKYEIYKKKQIKDEGIISSLKKDNKKLQQVQNENENIIEKFLKEISTLKKQNIQLLANYKKIELEKQNVKIQEAPELKRQITFLQQQIVELKKIMSSDQQRKKQLEMTIHKLRSQNDQLFRQLQRKNVILEGQKERIQEQHRLSLVKLQEQNVELKKRNQIIEESFIQHLTQTSLNLQHNIKNQFADKSLKNTTLNLQDSPIRTRSRGREKERKRSLQSQQDPQKQPKKPSISKEPTTASTMAKLKLKLQLANKKIIQLLCQKAQNHYLYNNCCLKVRS